jgi:hypothetical protein
MALPEGKPFSALRVGWHWLVLTISVSLSLPTATGMWLGFSSASFTGDIYSHVLPDIQKAAATELEEFMSAQQTRDIEQEVN